MKRPTEVERELVRTVRDLVDVLEAVATVGTQKGHIDREGLRILRETLGHIKIRLHDAQVRDEAIASVLVRNASENPNAS